MLKTPTQDRDQILITTFRDEMQSQLLVMQTLFRNEIKKQLHEFGEVHVDPLRDDIRMLKSQMCVMDKNIDMLNVRLGSVENTIETMEEAVHHIDGFLRKKFTDSYTLVPHVIPDLG